jgi:hypothetical protein
MALVPLIIHWGANTSSDKLRRCARCTKCGSKGATLQHPGWVGEQIGFAPFPVHKVERLLSNAAENDLRDNPPPQCR